MSVTATFDTLAYAKKFKSIEERLSTKQDLNELKLLSLLPW